MSKTFAWKKKKCRSCSLIYHQCLAFCLTSVVIVQLSSWVQLFANPWTGAHQASLSFSISQSLLKLMSIKSVIHPTISSSVTCFSSCPQPFQASRSFPMSWLFTSGSQITGASALASVLPKNIQGWPPLGLTDFTFLQSKGLSRIFSKTTIWKHQFFSAQPYLWSDAHIHM